MGLPEFPQDPGSMTRDDAINQIISSIAMEELGLSHILNAEGEKLQYVLGTLEGSGGLNPTLDELIQVNDSVQRTLSTAMQNQMFLQNKMATALGAAFPVSPDPSGTPSTRGLVNPPADSLARGMVVPAYDDDDAPGYVMGQMVMSGGKVYVVVEAPPVGEPGRSDDYAPLGGGDDSDNDDGDDDIRATLQFSSGPSPATLIVAPLGVASTTVYIGDGIAMPGADIMGTPFTLPVLGDSISVAVGTDGTLDSLVANFTTDAGAAASLEPIQVHAQLYYAAPGSDAFEPIAASKLDLDPPQPALSVATAMTASFDDINFPVAAGGRLILAYNTTSGLATAAGALIGAASASATII